MEIKRICRGFGLALMISLAGCGGGGGGTTGNAPVPTSQVTISGVASKGPIKKGTVNVYVANSNGTAGKLLATATTDILGHYSADVVNYSGPVIVEASGSYLDEATGQTRTIDRSAPLRAALPALSGTTVSLAVTPLTDLAFRKAQAAVSNSADVATAISNANSGVSALFNVNITSVQPVEPTQAALQGATPEQQNYSLALAAVSQMASDSSSTVSSVIDTLRTAGSAAPILLSSSVNTFLTSNPNNSTGYKSLNISLALTGVTTNQIGSLDFTVDIPAGITVESDSDGGISPNNFTITATGATNTVTAITKLTAGSGSTATKLHVILLDTNLLSNGQFATLRCITPTAIQVGDYIVESRVVARDANGVAIPGVGVTLQ